METVKWLGLSLTESCNLSCKYCSVDAKSGGLFLDFHKVKSFFDFFSPFSDASLRIVISGGEPLLHPKLLEIIKYAEDLFLSPQIVLVTNGVAPAGVFEELLKKTKIMFQITFEGLPEIHDTERVTPNGEPTSHDVLKTLKQILAYDPERLMVRVNYSPKKFGRETEIAAFFESLGVKKVAPGIMAAIGRGKDYPHIDVANSMKKWPGFVKILQNRDMAVRVAIQASSEWPPCGAGKHSFFLTVDGKLSVCQSILNTRNMPSCLSPFIVGDVNDEVRLNREKLEAFLKFSSEFPENCRKCDFKTFCSGCPLEKARSGGSFPATFCSNMQSQICGLIRQDLLDNAKLKKACGLSIYNDE